MKSKITIYFEEPFDERSDMIYSSFSEDERESYFRQLKNEIEVVVRSEFASDVENLKIEIKVEDEKEFICYMCGKSKTKNECLCTDDEYLDESY